ncbi:hypothetical protein GCM10025868_30910 [Angustibacter aerolatus]|uniref:ABC transporter domain-containing protein n=1 Tax=Angustibacter aerolatus TaxID=1162965 RepID=A0ABQ6JJU9_9ACTN|nr:ATP-binding cassette domain-containing protein [Angustibacter aerolatus]GMA87841.1 hypothetical protein GCM10025868_30910 [Angustibacter aerolatus]
MSTSPTATSTDALSVTLDDVHLAFGRNQVLRGVSLHVPAGTTTCVVGPSGSGKSTALRIVNRLLEPDSGDLLVDGRSVLADDVDEHRKRIGMVFQQFNLFPHRTVLDNVTLALRHLRGLSPDAAEHVALQRLDAVGLRHKASSRPAQALGRSAAARRHRPCARPRAARHAVRRGDVGARPRAW